MSICPDCPHNEYCIRPDKDKEETKECGWFNPNE